MSLDATLDDNVLCVAYADGHDCAATSPAQLVGDHGHVVLGWMPEHREWLAEPIRGWTVMGGYALGAPVADGRLRYLPTRLSAVPHVLATLRPDIVVISAVRRGGELAYGRSVGWAPAAADLAAQVVVEIDETAEDIGAPPILCDITRTVTTRRRMTAPSPFQAGPPDRAIAEHVVSLLPGDATLQFGPGAIADVVVRSIDTPVHVWSGLLTDAVAELAARGLLRAPAVGAYVYGGVPITELCRAGGARLTAISETHDARCIADAPAFVALNTALQVGLDGSVNVERVRGRLVAGMGGHPDFCAAAARAPDGLSIIALRSTHRGWSTIVPQVETVSTPRCDVDVVVTEHGVADLRGLDDAERAHRIIGVAAPEHRAELEDALHR
ncbi:MAG TPA: acetyl-CoA hydrolase/transferase C-terminal domain-containing protein [Acidimicrobiia bacterium]|nr:acetyl-CoA hydrolase/transferase C-terminal domain-containing protein [Acidimicrobiia bacterium]